MRLGLYWHPDISLHDLHAGHVAMSSTRIQSVTNSLKTIPGVFSFLAKPATQEQLEYAHDPEYLAYLASSEMLPDGETLSLSRDTDMNRYSWQAMRLSAGAVCQAVTDVLERRVEHAFCSVYAGHHAEYHGAGGFCFINSALVGAYCALNHGRGRDAPINRISVLDFDTHSGNGTVLGLLNRPGDVLFAETYQPGYPGAFLQKRTRPAHILRKKCTRRIDFLQAWEKLFAEVRAYQPQLIMVSAGFDAHAADPLGALKLQDEDYGWLASNLRALGVPVVATLEGGYSTSDVARCATLFVERLISS